MALLQSLLLSAAAAAAVSVPSLPLQHANNVSIPRLLLGTGGGDGGFDAALWLQEGGAGFDTAQTYCYFLSPRREGLPAAACSQVAIANALSVLEVDYRTQFIISKIEPEDMGALPVLSGFGRVLDRGILQEMSVPRLDMLMMHQAGRGEGASNVRPACFDPAGAASGQGTYAKCRLQTFLAFQQLASAGTVRSVAVSNWQVRDLEQVYNATGLYPAALEVEVHPWWHEDALLDYCLAKGIAIINYAPLALAQQQHLSDPTLTAIAAAHAITPAQALLLWGLQRTQGVLIPRSANASHMKLNMAVFCLPPLSAAEMQALAALPQKKIFSVYCEWCSGLTSLGAKPTPIPPPPRAPCCCPLFLSLFSAATGSPLARSLYPTCLSFFSPRFPSAQANLGASQHAPNLFTAHHAHPFYLCAQAAKESLA